MGVACTALMVFLVRVSGPSNLMDKDQERPAAYVADILLNGHWLCPHDWTGAVASKPPLSVWISALASRAVGGIHIGTLDLPGGLGIGGAAIGVALVGRRLAGSRAGLLGAFALLFSPLALKLIALNRTDGFFLFTVGVTGYCAWHAWETGRGWTWFWLAASAATLVKGPLGLIIGGAGLLAERWERQLHPPHRLNGLWGPGIALYLTITLGWLLAAVSVDGLAVVRKMLGAELLGHAIDPDFGPWGRGLVVAPAYLACRFLPWSAATVVGLFRVFREPAQDPRERRLERFAALWLLGGLVPIALATHQRGDLIAPLLPPAALLAGRELSRWTTRFSDNVVYPGTAALAIIAILGIACGYRAASRHSAVIQRSEGMRLLAARARQGMTDGEPILFVDTPYALQAHLNRLARPTTYAAAAAALRNDPAVMVAFRDLNQLRPFLGDGPIALETVAVWPESGPPWAQIVRRAR